MTRPKQLLMTGAALLSLPALFAGVNSTQAAANIDFANPAFRTVWARTDLPVANHTVVRTWFWGPAPNSPGLLEPNKESPGGTRLVQYFDKSRMEINNPAGNPNDQFFVTNGLLTVELVSGRMQTGEATYETRSAACIPVTGDYGDMNAPTYAAMQKVTNTTLGDHFASDMTGQVITATINHTGTVGTDPAMSVMTGTKVAYFDTVTKHNIPQVFWQFLNQSGPVYENGNTTNAQLINPWFYASGRPISEAYWTHATVQGKMTDVMVQLYERRALTYVPTYVPGFQVEMANIGQHYYDWRYNGAGGCNGAVNPTAVPTVAGTLTPGATTTANPSGTAVATGTAQATTTAMPSGTTTAMPSGTTTALPTTTLTVIVPTTTVVPASPSASPSTSPVGTMTISPVTTTTPAPSTTP